MDTSKCHDNSSLNALANKNEHTLRNHTLTHSKEHYRPQLAIIISCSFFHLLLKCSRNCITWTYWLHVKSRRVTWTTPQDTHILMTSHSPVLSTRTHSRFTCSETSLISDQQTDPTPPIHFMPIGHIYTRHRGLVDKGICVGMLFHSLAPRKYICNLKLVNFKLISRRDTLGIYCKIAHRWMSQNPTNHSST